MGFSTRPWTERLKGMGDKAEGAFELYAAAHGLTVVRFGFNRPPFTRFSKLPEFLRFTPDFVWEGKTGHGFAECKGTAGSTLKIKVKALNALGQWHETLPVLVFMYNSKNDHATSLVFPDVWKRCQTVPIQQFSNDKNEFYEIDVSDLTWEKL